MIKTNLPVLVLKGIVLLPNNDIRIEFDNSVSKEIIDVSELFHDNLLFLVSLTNPLEESSSKETLPKYGVIAKISHKLVLPNGFIRVILTGMERAIVHEYLNLNHSAEILETIVSNSENPIENKNEEKIFVQKLLNETEKHIKMLPYASNSILSMLKNTTSLSKITDLIAPTLPITYSRFHEYLKQTSPEKRMEMILEDFYQEEELFHMERNLDSKVKKTLDHNQKEYILREKIKAIQEELGEKNSKDEQLDELSTRIQNLSAPSTIKERLKKELKKYQDLPSTSPELAILENYMDTLLSIPWSSMTEDLEDLKLVQKRLEESHYGLEKVKQRILEYLAVKQQAHALKGPILCFVGPPGVGKTSLAFSIAKAMNRNFVKISVGGLNDVSEIMGHRKTYIGASPGKIITQLKKAKSMNPVFLIDEIDKLTKDVKGDPASALLEVLDPEQNRYFTDNYIDEEVDLSNIFFIATANYLEDIPEALKDRLEIIELSSYTEYEKLDIAKKYLLPKICKQDGLTTPIFLNDDVLLKIIREYTKEAGVRSLERFLETIVRKEITNRLMGKRIIRRFTVSKIEEYLGRPIFSYAKAVEGKVGVVNGLAYTNYGGDVLPIEVNFYKGEGNLILTGSLGDVMKESAYIALSYVKANANFFSIPYQKLKENDIHIHVPEGAVPKDGPSAGITLVTALISAFSNRKVKDSFAMTGEITLRGDVLPIGGVREKSIGAHRNGMKTILLPFSNQGNLDEVPMEVKKDITYIFVKNYKEVFENVFEEVEVCTRI